MIFFPGWHQPSDARYFPRVFISVNRLTDRVSDFAVNDWIMDSGAFTALDNHGRHVLSVEAYAQHISRWGRCGNLLAAVTQDYMCEPFMLAKLGSTVEEHQAKTIARYVEIYSRSPGTYIMPVLQGWQPRDYARHLRAYGELLGPNAWVGVGSVCKRQGHPALIEHILDTILRERADLRLHGFGVKLTALQRPGIRRRLYSADSMASSFAARKQGRNANDWREAAAYTRRIESALNPPPTELCFLN